MSLVRPNVICVAEVDIMLLMSFRPFGYLNYNYFYPFARFSQWLPLLCTYVLFHSCLSTFIFSCLSRVLRWPKEKYQMDGIENKRDGREVKVNDVVENYVVQRLFVTFFLFDFVG